MVRPDALRCGRLGRRLLRKQVSNRLPAWSARRKVYRGGITKRHPWAHAALGGYCAKYPRGLGDDVARAPFGPMGDICFDAGATVDSGLRMVQEDFIPVC